MLKTLSIKEAIIISLKLGYVDDKYFSTESIAQFLGIDNQEVIETTKKVLMLYRDNINSFIDTAINAVNNTPTAVIKANPLSISSGFNLPTNLITPINITKVIGTTAKRKSKMSIVINEEISTKTLSNSLFFII